MIVCRCPNCKKLVWFWQSHADIELLLKSGETKSFRFCIQCGTEIALKAIKQSENGVA